MGLPFSLAALMDRCALSGDYTKKYFGPEGPGRLFIFYLLFHSLYDPGLIEKVLLHILQLSEVRIEPGVTLIFFQAGKAGIQVFFDIIDPEKTQVNDTIR